MLIVLGIHSLIRWLIVLVGLVLLVRLVIGLLKKAPEFAKMDNGLQSGFAGLVDLQMTIGIILLIWQSFGAGRFLFERLEHVVPMILVAVLAHMPARWKEEAAPKRYKNSLIVLLIIVVLIYLGVLVLDGGWAR